MTNGEQPCEGAVFLEEIELRSDLTDRAVQRAMKQFPDSPTGRLYSYWIECASQECAEALLISQQSMETSTRIFVTLNFAYREYEWSLHRDFIADGDGHSVHHKQAIHSDGA